jgi:hypothetical protein
MSRGWADYLPMDPATSEAQFQQRLVQYAESRGWIVNHTRRAKVRKDQWATPTSVKGWPDLTLVRDTVLMFAELKADKKYPDPDQRAVLAALEATGVAVYVWRPRDWLDIRALLT